MPKLSQLTRETGEVTIASEGDEPLRITYRKAFTSPKLAEQLGGLAAKPPLLQIQVLANLVHSAVVSWNLTDEAGDPIPLTLDAVSGIDSGALQLIMAAIQEDIRPDPLNGGSSNGTSALAESSEPSPIGTRS